MGTKPSVAFRGLRVWRAVKAQPIPTTIAALVVAGYSFAEILFGIPSLIMTWLIGENWITEVVSSPLFPLAGLGITILIMMWVVGRFESDQQRQADAQEAYVAATAIPLLMIEQMEIERKCDHLVYLAEKLEDQLECFNASRRALNESRSWRGSNLRQERAALRRLFVSARDATGVWENLPDDIEPKLGPDSDGDNDFVIDDHSNLLFLERLRHLESESASMLRILRTSEENRREDAKAIRQAIIDKKNKLLR